MSYACKHVGFLKRIHRCGKSKFCHLIGECDQERINAICECTDNVLRGNVPITTRQKKRIEKHREVLQNIADPSIDWKRKRKFLQTQEGRGIITTTLGIALPALISWLASR